MAEPIEVCDVYVDGWELCNLVKSCGWANVTSAETIQKAVLCVVGQRGLSVVGREILEKRIASLLFRLSSKWARCGRREDRFRLRNEQWLNTKLTVKVEFLRDTDGLCDESEDTGPVQRAPFSYLSERSKRRKSMEIATGHGSENLLKATGQRARKGKKHDLAYLATEADASPAGRKRYGSPTRKGLRAQIPVAASAQTKR